MNEEKTVNARFVTTLTKAQPYETIGLPEIVMLGRSNVGKSSLINRICRRNKLARTSSQPGKTRAVNVYTVEERVNLLDLPGYGYAKVSKQEKESWGQMIDRFLSESENICHAFHVVDIRHEPSRQDVQMASWLHANELPFTVIATKVDKIGRDRRKYTQLIGRTLAVQPWQIVPFSAETGEGVDAVWALINEIVQRSQDSQVASADGTAEETLT